jgi:Flp pilus assembly protein TadD
MNTRRIFSILLLAAAASALATQDSFCRDKQQPFYEIGTLTEMQAVPCGARSRGFTGIGGLLATAGIENVNSKDKLCQEYTLRTSYIEYRIRPLNDKDPGLLPVGEKSHFRIVKNHVLLAVPDGDGKTREYVVVGMKPLKDDPEDSDSVQQPGPPELQRRPPAGPASQTPVSQTVDPPPANPSKFSLPAVVQPPVSANSRSTATLPPSTAPVAEAVLSSSTAAPAPQTEPTSSANKPLTRAQVMGLVAGGVPSPRVAELVRDRGISFEATPDFLTDLKSAGASDELLNALSAARSPAPTAAPRQANAAPSAQPSDPARLQRLAQDEQQARVTELARPGDPSAHFALASVMGQEGKWSEAAAQYAAVLSSEPDDAAAHNNLALALRKAGDIDGAIREYRRALALDPTSAPVHDNLGVALSQKGDSDGAIAEFREAIRQDPTSCQAHSNLGSMLEQRHDPDGAIREYRQALSLGGGSNAQYNLAAALERKGELDAAVAGFRKVLATNPNNVRAHSALAGALERKGDVAGALAEYSIAIKLAPQDPDARANYDRLAKSAPARDGGSGR